MKGVSNCYLNLQYDTSIYRISIRTGITVCVYYLHIRLACHSQYHIWVHSSPTLAWVHSSPTLACSKNAPPTWLARLHPIIHLTVAARL